MNRGDRREPIFKDDLDRRRFLETLGESCAKTGWRVLAYCLMDNHFHLVVETPLPNLVAGMKWLLGTYTSRFNRRHKLFGHLFSGRYKALVVDGSDNGYGLERAESAEERATRIVEEELARAGWTEEKLRQRPKGDPIKVAAAARLRRETTMTLKWISQRLEMGAWTHLKRRLYEQRRSEGETPS